MATPPNGNGSSERICYAPTTATAPSELPRRGHFFGAQSPKKRSYFLAQNVFRLGTWWKREGWRRWNRVPKLLVLGGSNSCTSWAWEIQIQAQLCNASGFTVTIAHFHPHRRYSNRLG